MSAKAVRKYLASHAEREVEIASVLEGRWQHVAVVPACGEGDLVFGAIESLALAARASGQSLLVILVVNGRESASEEVHRLNAELLRHADSYLGSDPWIEIVAPHFYCLRARLSRALAECDVLVVDRASAGRRFPARQGVGLARKIGCDIALALGALGAIASPWIHTTDADARVPEDYFDAALDIDEGVPAAALTYPFWHEPVTAAAAAKGGTGDGDAAARALELYEISLRYYVLGLRAAGSPYAFHTVGSAMAVSAAAYARVRGVPKLAAAEDFYLLNKLAKTGTVRRPAAAPIKIIGRDSDRVPFGTGRAMARIAANGANGDQAAFRMYDPRTFAELGVWLSACDRFAAHGNAERSAAEAENASALAAPIFAALWSEIGVPAALRRAHASSPDAVIVRRHVAHWFDAFRTLKLVHALRRDVWPEVAWSAALARAPFVPTAGDWDAVPLGDVRRALARLETRELP